MYFSRFSLIFNDAYFSVVEIRLVSNKHFNILAQEL
jgi:hypothetical protein